MVSLKLVVDEYMAKVSGLDQFCERCLATRRWGGSVVTMIVDAAFTSIGLAYFTSVVPKVELFRQRFLETEEIVGAQGLAAADVEGLLEVWRNRRSWDVARGVARHLSSLNLESDLAAFRSWADHSRLENWRQNPIGSIRGVGLVTYQYLRMMGGVDTVMPDKIVKRVVNEMLRKAGMKQVTDDYEFIETAEELAAHCGYRPIEVCWMTWLVQPEGKLMRMDKYRRLLGEI